MGNSPQIPNLQTESKYLDSFKSYRVFTDLGGGVPPWGVGGWEWGWVGAPPMHVRMHTHACMLNIINMAASMVAAICNFLTCLSSRFVCVHACMCVCLGTPPHAPQPICPLSRAAGSPNHQKFISPELIKIIRFCLKNLYLWTFLNSSRLTLITLHTPHPPPWSQRSRNLKNAIKRERIEIIEFRLKICDPWALLHTYRLDLMCRWGGGGVPSQMALLCFGPKKVHVFHSCDSLDKKILVFALDPTRPCLDWHLSRFLTSQPINEPFKIDLKWRPKWKMWLKSQFAKEPSTVEIFEM